MKLPAAVIVGMEKNGLGVARALSSYKVPCVALAGPHWTPSCQTNTCKVVYASSWTEDGIIHDLKSIGEKLERKSPLIITKDYLVRWISDSREEIGRYFELYLPDHPIVELLMDKSRFTEVALREGWPVPLTAMVRNKDELISKLKDIPFPCVLKPKFRNAEFAKHSPKKAFIISTIDELIRIYDMVSPWEKEVLVQEWIGGGDNNIAFCLSYVDRKGEPLAMFAGRKLRQWQIKTGNTAIAEPIPEEWKDSVVSLTEQIWRKVGFKGLGSIEYKIRPGTSTPIIMEPTVGRTNFQNEVAVVNGTNIPAIAYFDLIGQAYRRNTPQPKRPVKLIDGVAEIKAAWNYYRLGELGLIQWIKDRSGDKRYMTLRANDIGPFIARLTFTARRGPRKAWRVFSSLIVRLLTEAIRIGWRRKQVISSGMSAEDTQSH